MAHASGKAGEVDIGGTIAGVKGWSLDYNVDMLETTDFGFSGEKENIPGLTGWSGSFEMYKDGAPPSLTVGAAVTATFKETQTANQLWTGDGFITKISTKVDVDGIVSYSIDFQGTSTLTVPTA